MIAIDHISMKDCIIVTQAEFDRLREQKAAYMRVKEQIYQAEWELKRTTDLERNNVVKLELTT